MGIKYKGVTLIELLIAITIISVGIFPLLASFSNVVASTIKQEDQISALTLAKFQMDLYLNQFQLIDKLASDYPNNFTIISPGPGINIENEIHEVLYNESLFRISTLFEKQTQLSNQSQVSYKISLSVWKIQNPPPEDTFPQSLNLLSTPGFVNGDELLIEVHSLYSQKNTLSED